jgi:hypothetical protein
MTQRATLPYLTLVQAHCQNKFVIDTTQLRTFNNLHETTWQNSFFFLQTKQFSKMNYLQTPIA